LVSTEILREVPPGQRQALRQEVAMWRDLYGFVQVAPRNVGRYERMIRSLDLGPAWSLALRQMYVAARRPKAAEVAVAKGQERAVRQLMAASVIMFTWLAGVLAGLLMMARAIARRGEYADLIARPPEARLPSARALWSSFLLFLILFVLLQVLGASLTANQPITTRVVTVFGSYACAGLLAWIWLAARSKSEGAELAAIGLTARNLGRNIQIGVAGYAGLLPGVAFTLVVAQIAARLLPELPQPTHPIGPLIGQVADRPIVILVFVLVSMVAPFFEETFFRGVLYSALRERLSPAWAIVVSGSAFAAVHPQLPLGFLPLFILGAGFALLFAATRSLVPSMVGHSINNTLTFLVALFLLGR